MVASFGFMLLNYFRPGWRLTDSVAAMSTASLLEWLQAPRHHDAVVKSRKNREPRHEIDQALAHERKCTAVRDDRQEHGETPAEFAASW